MQANHEDDRQDGDYNARIDRMRFLHDSLMILRVVPDFGVPSFTAGQYATLGIGDWEPRVDGISPQQGPREHTLIRRAYSIACPMLDEQGQLVTCGDLDYLEFYVARVAHPVDDPPKLTPRLFAMRPGARLYMAPKIRGHYTLDPVTVDDCVIFLATGTGEAPHNAMLAELLARGHRGPIVSAVCVRWRKDLGYVLTHRELERRYSNYRYVALTTREPENLDADRPDFVGKQYLQDYVMTGKLEQDLGAPIDPSTTHVFLCGNPDMIGLPPNPIKGEESVPPPGGMVSVLTSLGFRLDRHHEPGNIHFERYW